MTAPDKDDLLYFLQLAIDCSRESLKARSESMELLVDIDSMLYKFVRESTQQIPVTASVLLFNAHASFRAAIRLAISGELMPVFMTLRGCIESALYANAMVQDTKLCDVWLSRGKNEDCRKECRKKFAVNKMIGALEQAHSQEFADRVKLIYDTSIDFGAHPNYKTILGGVQIDDSSSDETKLQFTYIHDIESFEARQSLIACAETGLRVLFIALICNPDHSDIESIAAEALSFEERVPILVKSLGLEGGPPAA
ncbi:MAG: hypothetical protein WDZ60_05450 [Wenzhouxiangellaceae bacterium]